MYCPDCGDYCKTLEYGGCGGICSISGCPKCNTVYQQTTGGILATPGGEQYSKYDETYDEMCYYLARHIKPYLNKWPRSDSPQKEWMWSEIGGPQHAFATEGDALTWLQIYQKQLRNKLNWPNCDKCGEPSEPRGAGNFECQHCKRWYIKAGYGLEARWIDF